MTRDALVARYRYVTGTMLPELARADTKNWPVHADHCFQRIVLDTVCGGIWTDSIPRPAYRNLSTDQAAHAVAISEDIVHGCRDIWALNRASLAYRAARRAEPPAQAQLL